MLVEDYTEIESPITGRLQRALPPGFAPKFVAASPTVEELRDWSLDPGIIGQLVDGSFKSERVGVGDPKAVGQLPVLVGLRVLDWARAQEQRLIVQATKIGLVRQEDLGALTASANALVGALVDIQTADPGELREELVGRVAFRFYQTMSTMIGLYGGPTATLAVSVIGFVGQIFSLVAKLTRGETTEARADLPILTRAELETSDEGRIATLRTKMGGSLDWSEVALPSTSGDWRIFEVGGPRPEPLGFLLARAEKGEDVPTAAAGFGFMPGTPRTRGMLQFTSLWRSVRDIHDDGGLYGLPRTANWGSHYCDPDPDTDWGESGRPCLIKPEDFAGDKDCRQCIPIDAIRGTTRGDWWDRLEAYESIAVNTGDWLINATQSYAALLDGLSVSNPSTWCFDLERIGRAWQRHDEDFHNFIASVWNRHDAYAWRALVSNFAAWGLVSNEDGRIAGRGTLLDWRVKRWNEWEKGISPGEKPGIPPVYSGCPADPNKTCLGLAALDQHAIQTIRPTPFLLRNSVWVAAIRPAINRIAQTQLAGYQTTMIAYLWEKQGAHWNAATGKLHNNIFGEAYEANMRELLNSKARVGAVHMGHVVDPVVRARLLEAGAKTFQTGGVIKPTQAQLEAEAQKPRRVGYTEGAIATFAEDWEPPPRAMPPVGGYPTAPGVQPATPQAAPTRSVLPWLAAAGLVGAGAYFASKAKARGKT